MLEMWAWKLGMHHKGYTFGKYTVKMGANENHHGIKSTVSKEQAEAAILGSNLHEVLGK